MAIRSLSDIQKAFVQELANLAYGRGTFDKGAVGGKGNMGLVKGEDGTMRLVKPKFGSCPLQFLTQRHRATEKHGDFLEKAKFERAKP